MRPKKARGLPASTLERLPRYLRACSQFEREGRPVVSSEQLARAAGLSPEALRKDLAHLGPFGRRGIGYDVATLASRVRENLGLTRPRHVVIVGVGHLGTSLLQYGTGFSRAGFRLVAAFDTDESKIGWELEGVKIWPMSSLAAVLQERSAEIALLAVPPSQAQSVADELAEAGVKAILNFTPAVLTVPPSVTLRNFDLVGELEHLTYFLDPPPPRR